VNDNQPDVGETPSLDSLIEFSPNSSGTYYLGVSSYSNFNYNPLVEGSGMGLSTGGYDLEINRIGSLGVRTDFTGDGLPDILYKENTQNTGQNLYYDPFATNPSQAWGILPTTPGWRPSAIGDLNGDLRPEVVFHNPNTGQNISYDNFFNTWDIVNNTPGGWLPTGMGDFNRDGTHDILYHNPNTGQNWVYDPHASSDQWTMLADTPGWFPGGVDDLTGDGSPDIVLYNITTSENAIYDPTEPLEFEPLVQLPGWVPGGVGDFNQDGHNDVIFHNSGTGTNLYYDLFAVSDNPWGMLNVTLDWAPLA
jgi:hypothetical protein